MTVPENQHRPVTPSQRAVSNRAVAMVARICSLPSVATLDWGNQAAGALASISPRSIACLIVCSLDAGGRIRSHEAAGVGSQSPGMDRTPAAYALRNQIEQLTEVGFPLEAGVWKTGQSGLLSDLVGKKAWRSSPLGRAWQEFELDELFVGIIPNADAHPGRALLCMVAINAPGDEPDPDWFIEKCALTSAMPLLGERADRAIALHDGGSARWLTNREWTVLRLLMQGKNVRQIAETIERSPHTVHDHIKGLHRKVGASSRGELIAKAMGYVDRQEPPQIEPFDTAIKRGGSSPAQVDSITRIVRGEGDPAPVDLPEPKPGFDSVVGKPRDEG